MTARLIFFYIKKKPLKQIILQSLQRDFEGVLLFRELRLGGLQVWSLGFHDFSQQLFLETVLGDCEVDQCSLRLHLWLVVRVRQFRLQNQTKLGIVVDFSVAYFNSTGKNFISDYTILPKLKFTFLQIFRLTFLSSPKLVQE